MSQADRGHLRARTLVGSATQPRVTDLPNATIAALFDELADLYELDGAVVHRVLAYRNAAKAVREAPRSVAPLTRAGPGHRAARASARRSRRSSQALLDTGDDPARSRSCADSSRPA